VAGEIAPGKALAWVFGPSDPGAPWPGDLTRWAVTYPFGARPPAVSIAC
jgi:hypothetical protein